MYKQRYNEIQRKKILGLTYLVDGSCSIIYFIMELKLQSLIISLYFDDYRECREKEEGNQDIERMMILLFPYGGGTFIVIC